MPTAVIKSNVAVPAYGFSKPEIIVKNPPPKVSPVFDTYWRFAAERQKVFMAKVYGKSAPWTTDPIIQKHRFTNAYRASDRVSQYLINNVIYKGAHSPEDTVFRVLLFKVFNKIETWQLLENHFGEISYSNFSPAKYGAVLEKSIRSGGRIYSAAYIMPSGPKNKYKGKRKHEFHFDLLRSLWNSGFPEKIISSKTMKEAYEHLLGVESFGKFLAYQFVTDINYSEVTNYSEMEFVVPGPGAMDGIRKCFTDLGGRTPEDIIRMMADEQSYHFERLGLQFTSLWGRQLQLIDCQNVFCETDKYSRVAHPDILGLSGRTRIKQMYSGALGTPRPWFPPKWKINSKIAKCPE